MGTITATIMAAIALLFAGISKKRNGKIFWGSIATLFLAMAFIVPPELRGFFTMYSLLAVGAAGYIWSAFLPGGGLKEKKDWVRFAITAISISIMAISLLILFG